MQCMQMRARRACACLVLTLMMAAFGLGAAAQDQKLLTAEDLRTIAPRAPQEYLDAIVAAEDQFEAAGITTRLRMAHFLAQVMTETGALRRLDENMNYSAEGLLRTFSRRVISPAKAQQLARQPEAIANWVYRNRLGNGDENSGDGWRYRGSGFIQLTGRANFRDRGLEVSLPLEQQPDLARQAREGLQAAIAYWRARGINAAADDNDRRRVRILVNGPAAHGFEQSVVYFNRLWLDVFRDKAAQGFETVDLAEAQAEERATEEAEAIPEAELFDAILAETGLVSAAELSNEAGGAAAREDALREFQRLNELPETGILDEATEEALLDPSQWRYSDLEAEAVMPSAPQAADPEQTVVIQLEADATDDGATAMESGTMGAETGPAALPSEAGSGATVADADLPPTIARSLGDARAVYSEYEMGDAAVSPDDFVPFTVIGDDTRAAVTPTTGFPARAVVQILLESANGRQHLCSGAMVSRDTVLTAAHCIHSGTVAGAAFRNFQVLPGRNAGAAPFGSCRAREAMVLSGWLTAVSSIEARYYDLGALKLDCAVGEQTGWLGVRSLTDDEVGLPTTVQGYAADRAPPGRQWRSDDQLRVMTELKGFYDNDTFGGTSGSPVLSSDDPSTIIGVHTNGVHGTEEPWSSHNAFTRITPQRLDRITSWIGG